MENLYLVAGVVIGIALLLLVGGEGGTPHLLTLAIALELLLLALALIAVASGTLLDDLTGPLLALLLLPIAGAESAVSLAHLIAFAPVRGTILLRLSPPLALPHPPLPRNLRMGGEPNKGQEGMAGQRRGEGASVPSQPW